MIFVFGLLQFLLDTHLHVMQECINLRKFSHHISPGWLCSPMIAALCPTCVTTNTITQSHNLYFQPSYNVATTKRQHKMSLACVVGKVVEIASKGGLSLGRTFSCISFLISSLSNKILLCTQCTLLESRCALGSSGRRPRRPLNLKYVDLVQVWWKRWERYL